MNTDKVYYMVEEEHDGVYICEPVAIMVDWAIDHYEDKGWFIVLGDVKAVHPDMMVDCWEQTHKEVVESLGSDEIIKLIDNMLKEEMEEAAR